MKGARRGPRRREIQAVRERARSRFGSGVEVIWDGSMILKWTVQISDPIGVTADGPIHEVLGEGSTEEEMMRMAARNFLPIAMRRFETGMASLGAGIDEEEGIAPSSGVKTEVGAVEV